MAQTHKERGCVRLEAEIRVMRLQVTEGQRMAGDQQKQEEKHEAVSLLEPPAETNMIQDFWPPKLWANTFLLAPSCGDSSGNPRKYTLIDCVLLGKSLMSQSLTLCK